MENESLENETPKNEKAAEESEPSEEENPETSNELKSALAQKEHWRGKAQELEEKLSQVTSPKMTDKNKVNIEEVAEQLSAMQGLDASERSRLIRESKLQGVPIQDARKSDDFKFWRSAYRAELKKKKAPEPSTKQGSTPKVDASKAAKALREGTIKKEEWDAVKGDPEKTRKFLRESGLTADYSRYDKRQVPGVKRSRPSKKARRIPYEKTTRVGKE